MKTIGILLTGRADRLNDDYIAPFKDKLTSLIASEDIKFVLHQPPSPLSDPKEMKRHARTLIDEQQLDVIWLLSTEAARAAIDARREAGKTDQVAIVGAAVSSVIRGLATMAGNFSGIINAGWDLGDDRYRFLKQMMGDRLRKVGVLVHPHEFNSSSEGELVLIQKAAGNAVVVAYIQSAADLAGQLQRLKNERADAVMTTHMPLFQHERKRIIQIARDLGMPVAGHRGFFADDGALMAYSSVLTAQMEQSARMVHRMLSTPAADPSIFEEPDEFELVVNTATAARFDLTLPATWTPAGLKVRTV
jgi:ABC-type uncharacterized transport system substrate-binding protein